MNILELLEMENFHAVRYGSDIYVMGNFQVFSVVPFETFASREYFEEFVSKVSFGKGPKDSWTNILVNTYGVSAGTAKKLESVPFMYWESEIGNEKFTKDFGKICSDLKQLYKYKPLTTEDVKNIPHRDVASLAV